MKARLKELFTKIITGQLTYDAVQWDKEPLDFLPLLDVLEEYNDKFKDEVWVLTCQDLTTDHLLPWARQHIDSRNWLIKNSVIRIFLLNPLAEDLNHMKKLLHDKAFSIRMLAAEAMGKVHLPEIIPMLISQMAREVPSARFIYRYTLLRIPHEHFPILLKIFDQSNNDRVKICCLDIMSHQFFGNILPLLRKHLTSTSATIRMMIANLLNNIQSQEARGYLMNYLNDPSPKVRATAVKALGNLRDEIAFEKVRQMLHDSNYDVRLAAAFALFEYGREGIRILELQDADLEPKAHEVARFVLTLP